MRAILNGGTKVNHNKCVRKAVSFIRRIFERPRRASAIMMQWHARPPYKDLTLQNTWATFVHTLMYSPLDVCVDSTGIYLFGTQKPAARAFFISIAWLDTSEKSMLSAMIHEASSYFTDRAKIYYGGHVMYTGFVANGTRQQAFNMAIRQKLLRTFTFLVYQVEPVYRLMLAMILQDLGIEKAEPFYVLLSKTLIGYTPDSPVLTPISVDV